MPLTLPSKDKKKSSKSSLVLPGQGVTPFDVAYEKKLRTEASSQTAIDKDLYYQLRKRGNDTRTVQKLEPEKISKTKEGLKGVGKTVGGFFGGMSRMAKAGFDVTGGLLGEVYRAGVQGGTKETTFKPGELLKIGVEEAKKTITTPGSEGIFGLGFRGLRFASKAAAAPLAAGLALPKGGVTPGQAFREAMDRAVAVATDKDIFESDWKEFSDEYMKKRKIGPYGTNEINNGDIAALAALQFFNMAGDLGVGELRALGKAGQAGKELAMFKKVGKVSEQLPEGTTFVKGTMKPVEIKVSDDLKFKIRPKTNEIVIEGYKRRFGGQKVLPEGAVPEEAKNLIPTIERTTGSQVVARMEGDSLVLKPTKSIGAPQKQLMLEAPKAPKTDGALFGKGFVATEKVDKAKAAQSKVLQDYQAARKAYTLKPTPASLKKVLKLREQVQATKPPKPTTPARGLFEEAKTPTVTNKIVSEKNTAQFKADVFEGKKETARLSEPKALEQAKLSGVIDEKATPDTTVTMYRASDKPIEIGDQVTMSKRNAEKYIEQRPGAQLQEIQVPLKDLVKTDGIRSEFIYAPKSSVSAREPIPSAGKEKESRFFKRAKMEKDTKLEGEVTYNELNLSEDEARAAKKVAEDFEGALEEVRSGTAKVDDTTFSNLTEAIGNEALKNGDIELFNEMARKRTLNATRAGQEIVSLRGKVSIDSPQGAVAMVLKNRITNKGGAKKVSERIKNTLDRDMKKVRARAAAMKSAQEIIDSITC